MAIVPRVEDVLAVPTTVRYGMPYEWILDDLFRRPRSPWTGPVQQGTIFSPSCFLRQDILSLTKQDSLSRRFIVPKVEVFQGANLVSFKAIHLPILTAYTFSFLLLHTRLCYLACRCWGVEYVRWPGTVSGHGHVTRITCEHVSIFQDPFYSHPLILEAVVVREYRPFKTGETFFTKPPWT